MADRALVLGATWGTHDSSAALFVDGQLVSFVEEERLSGRKHTGSYPEQAIAAVLDEVGATHSDVGRAAFSFHARGYLRGLARATAQLGARPWERRAWARTASYYAVHRRTRDRMRELSAMFPAAALVDVPHHLCHGRYTHAASGEEHVALLTVDSIGEWHSTTLAEGRGTAHQTVLGVGDPHSLGYAYGAVTEQLGYRRGDEEGTVMALASLGDPARFRAVFTEAIALTDNGLRLHPRFFARRVFSSSWPRLTAHFERLTAPRRDSQAPLEPVHADLAAALQQRTEETMLHLAQLAANRVRAPTLCLSGGVAMNCLAAARISASGRFVRTFVPPAPSDGGTSIGAALAVLGDDAVFDHLGRWDLGPKFSLSQIDVALTGRTVVRPADPVEHLVRELVAGRIVGLFRGRLEAGPRALGHRSILASPLVSNVTERLASHIKLREGFRPFAPIVPLDIAHELFEVTDASPYMSFAFRARSRAYIEVPAVVHANGTARVQTLRREDDAFLYEVLERFAVQTGVPVLINTSLNIKGAPMAGTPAAAIACFDACALDGLLLEDRYLTR
jgi:carbamoyltransferase